MTLPPAAHEALDAFAACPGWEQRARLLMQWGERLQPLTEAERNEANRVDGCDSLVWLVAERRGDAWHCRAASDARLVGFCDRLTAADLDRAILVARDEGPTHERLDPLLALRWKSRQG